MKLSVVIPCYNAEDTLAEQLDALSGQRWSQPWEVLLVDNRSTDRSLEIAEGFRGRVPNLRIVDASDRQGQPFALNAGAEAAQGASLAFCDADDVVGDGWVAAIGDALDEHDFVACRWDVTRLNTIVVQRSRGNAQVNGLQPYTNPAFLSHAGGGTLGVKRALHLDVGGFDETLPVLHDTDYCWRLQLRGVELHFVPDAVIHVRYRDTLRGVYHQSRSYGAYNVLLYKRYRDRGMPAIDWRRGLEGWIDVLKGTVFLYRPSARWTWARRLGWSVGRLEGCLKHRVFAP
ncbi:MAG: glycosyltransferase family 2 protein [Trueperaceae bacterium]|nr:glycosyltransferase family 2 protein [Trueperaceae bacterium]